MTNAVTIQNNEFSVLQMIAKTAHTSGLYNVVGGESKILMILLAAHDLGIKPTIALNGGIWNIQGKIEISARLMTSMIRRSGHSISIIECNAKICTLKGKRSDNGDEIESSFSIEDANKAGLSNRDVWKKYTEDMLYARAMSRLARRLFPDVIGTAYVEGEIRDAEAIDITPKKEEKKETFQIQEIPLTDEEEFALLAAFTSQYPDEKPDDIELFFAILKEAWKKPLVYVVEKYKNHELFIDHFEKWKLKNGK